MRSHIRFHTTLAGLLLAVSNPLAATTVKGVILANETGGPPIKNARVSAIGADNSVLSDEYGTFVLELPSKHPGDEVKLFVQRPWIVVNYFELRFTLPKDANAEPLTLLLCQADECQEMTRRFFGPDRFDPIEQRYQKQLEDLQAKNQATNAAKEQLRIELDRAREAELQAAKELARVKVEDFYAHPTSSLYRSDTAMALNNLGILYRRQKRMDDARKAYEDALQISNKLAQQDRDTYLPDVEETLNNFGNMLSDQHELQEAREKYEEALKIGNELARKEPTIYLPSVASTLNNLGILLRRQNQIEEARTTFIDVRDRYRKLATFHPATYKPRVVEALNNLGILYLDQNQTAEGWKAFSEALNIYEALAMDNPGQYAQEIETTYRKVLKIGGQLTEQNSTYRRDIAATLNNFGKFLRRQNRMDEARAAYDEALRISRELAQEKLDAYLPDVTETLNNLGILYQNQNRMDEARITFSEALAVEALAICGTLTREKPEKYAEVKSTYEALEISRQLAEQGPAAYLPKIALMLINLGKSSRASKELEDAQKAFSKALAIYERLTATSPELYGQKVESTRRLLDDVLESRRKAQIAASATGPAVRQTVQQITVTFVLVLKSDVCTGSYKPGHDCPVTGKTAEDLEQKNRASRAYQLSEGNSVALHLDPEFQQALTAGIDAKNYAVLLKFDWGNKSSAVVDMIRVPSARPPKSSNSHRRLDRSRCWYTHQNAIDFDPDKSVKWKFIWNDKSFWFSVVPAA